MYQNDIADVPRLAGNAVLVQRYIDKDNIYMKKKHFSKRNILGII